MSKKKPNYECELCGTKGLDFLVGLCPCGRCIAKIRRFFPHYNKSRNELGDVQENK